MSTPTTDLGGIQQTIRALKAAGWELDEVDDGEENIPVKTEKEATDAITAVDQAWMHVEHTDGRTGYVFFVMGNSPEEVICDHTVNLSDVLDPLTSSWF